MEWGISTPLFYSPLGFEQAVFPIFPTFPTFPIFPT